MAGAIGHVIYGQRIATYLGSDIASLPEFFAGTLFPDIRHLGTPARHRTHPEHVTLHSLVGNTDFATGMRAHVWLDNTRRYYLHKHHSKENIGWHPLVPFALKLLEDELLYPAFNDWTDIQHALHKTRPVEQELIDDRALIEKWHRILRDYVDNPPSDTTRATLLREIGLSTSLAQEINSVIDKLRKHPPTQTILTGFSHHLDQLLA